MIFYIGFIHSHHIFSDRRGIVTPEYRAEHESIGDDNVITNNKTYGTAKIVQPQVITIYSIFISLFFCILASDK